ncbi:MAG: ribose-phosphate pyrophosphokinase [Bdellovibrionales bacterium]|nr:ribose-phosphate pyrophosphokinase [Bdellovibrionales bacterium]
MSATRVYATARFEYLARALEKAAPERFIQGILHNSSFPNGEVRLEVTDFDEARDAEVVLIGGTEKEDFFDLLLYAGELAQIAGRLNILIPFYRYSTQERKDRSAAGHIVIAKGLARALSALPTAQRGNRVFLVEPHTESLPLYFDDTQIRAEVIHAEPLFAQIIEHQIGGTAADKVICSVDDGRSQAVLAIAEQLGLPCALVDKERISGSETRVVGSVNGDVRDRVAIMVDDMARTLGSAEGAAKAYLEAGAREVWLVAMHPDFAPGAIEKVQANGYLKGIFTTDTYPSHALADGTFAQVVPFAPYLARTLLGQFSF